MQLSSGPYRPHYKDYLSKQETTTRQKISKAEAEPRIEAVNSPSLRLVPGVDLILPDIGRSSSNYLFVSYNPRTKLPLHLTHTVPNMSSSLYFLLRVLSRAVGHKTELLLAAVGMAEVEVRRRTEIATLTVATLSATTELQQQDKSDLLQRT